ncbi:extracellular ligand-gated ion channel protein [Trifolium repens]|nr:extracellular ligand-gated ion channel protein [Trifolium repens]
MKPSTNDTTVDIDHNSSSKRVSFSENNHTNGEQHQQQHNVPLLLQPSYSRSKSIIFDELRNFRICLKWCALDHSSCVGKLISYVTFIFLTFIVPLFTTLFVQVSSSSPQDDPISLNKLVQIPESALAIISFFTLSRFFRRYGLRQLLFLDALQDDTTYVRRGYARELEKAFRYLAYIILPSFFVKLVHKIIFFSAVKISAPHISAGFPLNSIVFVLTLISWLYRTGVYLLVCVIFRLTCQLQILRFEGVHKLFEGFGSEAVLASKSDKSFFNSGDLVICSAVQLSGFFLCILGAAKITHRAQGIVSIATRWHMLVTNAFAESEQCKDQMSDAVASDSSDSDSSDIHISIIPQRLSSFHTRQSLVTYLQHNHGGITLYGFALDRGMLHTLFAFEFSVVLWILSKVVVLE